MRRIVPILTLLFLVASVAYPCGAKYYRQDLVRPPRPYRTASILIINSKNLQVHGKVKSILEQLGHKVKAVKDSDEVATALKSGKKYDIVMADISDMGRLARQVKAASSDIVPVPLTLKNSKAYSLKAKQYQCVVKLSSKSKEINKKINEALKLKEKAQKEKALKLKAQNKTHSSS